MNNYPDGWAVSCRTENLWDFAPLVNEVFSCRPRIGAWVKPFVSFKPDVNPGYAWEPVLFMGGRAPPASAAELLEQLAERKAIQAEAGPA